MSKYTTEVRYICETNASLSESAGYSNLDDILTACRSKIFDFEYPIFDEAYRPILEKKILKHYYTREIGAETVGLWKLWLDTRLNEIMPYYNELYKTTLFEYNPLYDIDFTREGSKTNVEEGSSTSETNGTNDNTRTYDTTNEKETMASSTTENTGTVKNGGTVSNTGSSTDTGTVNDVNNSTTNETNNSTNLYSDTPQGSIRDIDLEGNAYLTNANKIYGSNGSTTAGTSTRTDNLTRTEDNTRTDNLTRTDDLKTETNSEAGDTSTYTGTVTDNGANYSKNDTTKNNTNMDTYTERVFGKTSGSNYAKLVADFRKNLLNIDVLIIRDLSDLFMNVW